MGKEKKAVFSHMTATHRSEAKKGISALAEADRSLRGRTLGEDRFLKTRLQNNGGEDGRKI